MLTLYQINELLFVGVYLMDLFYMSPSKQITEIVYIICFIESVFLSPFQSYLKSPISHGMTIIQR